MGYPVEKELKISYDTLQMEREMLIDTIQGPDLNSRIEYQLLTTQKRLQEANVSYNKMEFPANDCC